MEELHNWLFHYNPYTMMWSAFKRDDLSAYFNGDIANTLSASKHSTLVEILVLTQGDSKKIEALLEHGTRFVKKITKG
jgi:hypothetical protein